MENLSEYIRHLRESRGLTLRQLASMSKVSHAQIHKIEIGAVVKPSQKHLEQLAKALMVPYETLDRMVRGLPPSPNGHPGWTAEVQGIVKELEGLPADKRDRFLQMVRDQLQMLRG